MANPLRQRQPTANRNRSDEHRRTISGGGGGRTVVHRRRVRAQGRAGRGSAVARLRMVPAIARALAVRPKIIIADEPTGNLDSARGEEIIKLLKELNKQGITLLVITHDMNVARQAGRVVEIHDGKIAERRK